MVRYQIDKRNSPLPILLNIGSKGENMEIDSGIYCFENNLNGKKYVGQAQSIYERLQRHNQFLRRDYDGCIVLQNAWNLYGEENFSIYTLELCEIDLLNEREIFWIKELHSHISEWGYNVSWGGDSFMRGRHHTDESKEKISKNSAVPSGELNWGYGIPVPEERKTKISNTMKKYYETHDAQGFGKKQTEETIQKRINSSIGKKRDDESKNNISKARVGIKGKKNSSSKYVGVSFVKKLEKWSATIMKNRKRIYLGLFISEIDAALAYNVKAIELYGENAKLNIIENGGAINDL